MTTASYNTAEIDRMVQVSGYTPASAAYELQQRVKVAAPAFETRRVVVLSWQHLRPATIDLLMNSQNESWPVLGGRVGPDMLIVYAQTELDDLPSDLIAAIDWAKQQTPPGSNPICDPGFNYILFDRDTDPRDDLPVLNEPEA